MFRTIVLPIAAICGISFAIFMIFWSARKPPQHPIEYTPPTSPYIHYVAGEGMIESLDENVRIGVSFPDLIWENHVKAGQLVQKGDLLFKIDTRQQEADLHEAISRLYLAKTNYADQKQQFEYYEQLTNKSAVSEQEYTAAYYAKQKACDELKVALANVRRIQTIIERAHIRAPKDGQVLQENARVGEFANVNPFDRTQLLLFGDVSKLQMRVNIAEEDAWRVMSGAPGMAYVRGNAHIQLPLTFKYIEPLLVPKQSLTGTDFERVDTRVLQVVYEFEKGNSPVYVGQLLDVYLEAQPSRGV